MTFTIGQHVKMTTDGPFIRGKIVDFATTEAGKQIVLIQAHESPRRREWWEAEKVELVPDPAFSRISDRIFEVIDRCFDGKVGDIEGFPAVFGDEPQDIDPGHHTRCRISFGNREVEINITEVAK